MNQLPGCLEDVWSVAFDFEVAGSVASVSLLGCGLLKAESVLLFFASVSPTP